MTVSIRTSLQLVIGNLTYQSQPQAFTPADPVNVLGPTPGAVVVPVTGVDIDLSQLVQPGLCRIMNIDDTNFVTYGIWDADNSALYPLGELLPAESYIIRLSRQLGEKEAAGTGTGATNTLPCTLRFKADSDSVNILVEAFDS